jgi:hypothetical protein
VPDGGRVDHVNAVDRLWARRAADRQADDERVDVKGVDRAVTVDVGIQDVAVWIRDRIAGGVSQRQDERVDVERVNRPVAVQVA